MRNQIAAVVGAERLGDDRPPRRPGEFHHFQGHARVGQITKQDKGFRNRREALALTTCRHDLDPRRPMVTAIKALGPTTVGSKIGHQRLTKGNVEMNRTGVRPARPDGRRAQARHDRPPYRVLAPAALRRAQLVKQADGMTEQLTLVGGLVRAGPAQLRRAVSTDDDQGHCGVAGLQYCWVQVGDRGSGRREHRHRPAGQLGHPQGQEGSGALVDPNVQPKTAGTVRFLQGVGERGRAGTGTKDRLADPVADHLVHHDGGQSGRRIHAGDPATPRKPRDRVRFDSANVGKSARPGPANLGTVRVPPTDVSSVRPCSI